jgi:hypothetical protein
MKKMVIITAFIILGIGLIYSAGGQITPIQKKYYLGDGMYYKYSVTNETTNGTLDNNYFTLKDLTTSYAFRVTNCNDNGVLLSVYSRGIHSLSAPSADSVNWIVYLYGNMEGTASSTSSLLLSQDTLDANDFTDYSGWMYKSYSQSTISNFFYLWFYIIGTGQMPYDGTLDYWYVVFNFDDTYIGKE